VKDLTAFLLEHLCVLVDNRLFSVVWVADDIFLAGNRSSSEKQGGGNNVKLHLDDGAVGKQW